jgi:hypothetical protein
VGVSDNADDHGYVEKGEGGRPHVGFTTSGFSP